MKFKKLTSHLLNAFTNAVKESPLRKLDELKKVEVTVDYFQFYNSVSAVYSSKIEGEDIAFDSFFKHKFLNVKFKPDYIRRADDLYSAYDFIENQTLSIENVQQAHAQITKNILPKSQRGLLRSNPMFVLNSQDLIDYVAAPPELIRQELKNLFGDIHVLINASLKPIEVFYYAAFIHLVFVKIHPFQDGNGRTARLLEKWFLLQKLGNQAVTIPLEKNYYRNRDAYYFNLKKLGLEYEALNYDKALDFLLMTIQGLDNTED